MGCIVVKLGGDVLADGVRTVVAEDIARAVVEHPQHRFGLVHGGGPQVTALARRLGVDTQTVAGRRVTDAGTLEVLTMVVAGQLNVQLCTALLRAGARPVGLHAGSGAVRAGKRPPRVISGGPPGPVDLGLVGDVVGFDLALLETLWGDGRLPVLSCLGYASAGEAPVLNLNADLVASRLAEALAAPTFVAVSGVGGLRKDASDPASRLSHLTVAEAQAAIASGSVTGGMIPKLEEAFVPLGAGVGAFHIVGPGEVRAALGSPGSVGTLLSP